MCVPVWVCLATPPQNYTGHVTFLRAFREPSASLNSFFLIKSSSFYSKMGSRSVLRPPAKLHQPTCPPPEPPSHIPESFSGLICLPKFSFFDKLPENLSFFAKENPTQQQFPQLYFQRLEKWTKNSKK